MRKAIVSFMLMLTVTISCFGQSDSVPEYKRHPELPAFTVLKADTILFTRDNLLKSKNTLILVFSPVCEHCQHLIDSMLFHIDQIKHIQILMVSFGSQEKLVSFYRQYNLAQYENIKVARDFQYFFVPFFKVKGVPFMAFYDTNGRFITTRAGEISMRDVVAIFEYETH